MSPKRIVLIVEGEGDVESAPVITKRLIEECSHNAWGNVFIDSEPIRIGDVTKVVKDDYKEWRRKLGVCRRRKNLGGVLLLLDGDIRKVGGAEFCAVTVARTLALEAKKTGAGKDFSVCVTFARQEFETWGIASCKSLSGLTFADGLQLKLDLAVPNTSLEEAPRNAKKWITSNMVSGTYSETRHQKDIARNLDFEEIRSNGIRSFVRFENSITELLCAIENNEHVSTPTSV